MPGPLHALARWLPQTYTIDAIHRLLLHDEPAALVRLGSLSPLANDVVMVVAITVVTLGRIAFRFGIRKA